MENAKTMFIIQFVEGRQRKYDDDRFKIVWGDDRKYLQVISRITGDVMLDVPNPDTIIYIMQGIKKKVKPSEEAEESKDEVIPVNEYDE